MKMQIPLKDVKVGEEFETIDCGRKLMKGNIIQQLPSRLSVIYLEPYASLKKGDIRNDWSEDELVEVDRTLRFSDIKDGEEFKYQGDIWIKVKRRNNYNAVVLKPDVVKAYNQLDVGLFHDGYNVEKV